MKGAEATQVFNMLPFLVFVCNLNHSQAQISSILLYHFGNSSVSHSYRTEGSKAYNRDFCRCNLYSLSVSGLRGWCCSCSKPQREWQDGPSEHTIDWDDWIEAWLKVQQDLLKRPSVWTGIMRQRDQTLYYHNPICTARSIWQCRWDP